MEAPEPRTFYRIVTSDPPTLEDFKSYRALGKPLRRRNPTSAEIASWEAVSTYVTEYYARQRAEVNRRLGFPLGEFVAKLILPEVSTITIGRANQRTGHCDLTGEPEDLLAAVVSVERL